MTPSNVLQDFRNLDRRKQAIIAAVVGLVILGVAAIAFWPSSNQRMELLYSQLSTQKAGEVVGQLDQMGVNYTLKGGGTTIMVPQGQAASVRMQLAEQGIPSSKAKGYEILDQQDPMGMTDFLQRVQRKRALQGELAQSIMSMNAVESARVHIVMPERQPFAREAPTPEASVTVNTGSAAGLDKESAAGIQSLVASAVPKLSADKVTVVDSSGAVVTAESDGGVTGGGDLNELRRQREAQIRQAIHEVLAPYLGRGNIRATVTAEIDRSAETIKEKNFDQDQRVLRSVQSMEETESSEEQEPENVSAGENTPADGANGQQNATSTSEAERNEETRNFEIGNTTRTERQPAGALEAVNVAVVVDGSYEAGENGQQQYVPRSDNEMQRIRELVRSAVGFEDERGDKLSVQNARFRQVQAGTGPQTADTQESDGTLIGFTLWELVAFGVLLLILVAAGLFGWRVLQDRQGDADGTQAIGQSGEAVAAVPGPDGEATSQETVSMNDQDHAVDRNTIERIRRHISESPENTAFALQQMLASQSRS